MQRSVWKMASLTLAFLLALIKPALSQVDITDSSFITTAQEASRQRPRTASNTGGKACRAHEPRTGPTMSCWIECTMMPQPGVRSAGIQTHSRISNQ